MLIVIIFLFGLIVGSFLNVLILRLPAGQSITGRSRCPGCDHQLKSWDLIPVLSYLVLRGRCRYCRRRVSARYAIIELLTGLLFVLGYVAVGPLGSITIVDLVRVLFIISVLLAVFVIDLEEFLILDRVVFPASVIVLFLNIFSDLLAQKSFLDLSSATIGGFIMAALFFSVFFFVWLVSKGRWIGFGDVKFMIFLGLALGWPQTLTALFIAFVSGGFVGSILLISGRKTMQSRLPLGTFLSVGALTALLWGQQLVNWYWQLLGFGVMI